MPTPQEQVILSVTKNKVQLNAMLAEALLDPGFYAQTTSQNSLIIADVTDVPVQITHDLKNNGRDLSSSHEEAVVIITQLAVAMSLEDKSVCVVCEDTHECFSSVGTLLKPDVLKSSTHDHGFSSARQGCD